eukprot:CAMPEP_0198268036 /NCGR_PEP_ID=MMETSP1447-20131203/35597_1 /TAXON_ID=420782 /ORGANISM="Chaetoceros dichaeta, Strain CCMP1751" /LENGTH=30 /DNA_ID= /DNA_START= /DNA_END= /DNA_ORIENTATION=
MSSSNTTTNNSTITNTPIATAKVFREIERP